MNKFVTCYVKVFVLFLFSFLALNHCSEVGVPEEQIFTQQFIQNILKNIEGQINTLQTQTNSILTQLIDVIKNQQNLVDKTGILMAGISETFNKSREIGEKTDLIIEIDIEIKDNMIMIEQEISAKFKRDMVDLRENLVQAIHNYQSPINCPVNSHRFGGECLVYLLGARDWNSWRKHCRDLGGDLASLDYPELPFDLLLKVLPELTQDLKNVSVGMYATLFLGGKQDWNNRKTWLWMSGEQLLINDSRWFKDQPDMTLELSHHCLGIRFLKVNNDGFEIGFEDISCGFRTTAICEMPKKYVRKLHLN